MSHDDLIARLNYLKGDEQIQNEAADAIAALVAENKRLNSMLTLSDEQIHDEWKLACVSATGTTRDMVLAFARAVLAAAQEKQT